jgi:hypothetical protein
LTDADYEEGSIKDRSPKKMMLKAGDEDDEEELTIKWEEERKIYQA